MSILKHINDPAVRAAHLADRQERLAEYDRLVGNGLSGRKAARRVGIASASGISAMRHSVDLMTRSGHHYGPGSGSSNIDLGLALLSVLRRPEEALTCADIAAWCDCSPSAIHAIEQRALRKVRRRVGEMLRTQELGSEVEDLLARLDRQHAPV